MLPQFDPTIKISKESALHFDPLFGRKCRVEALSHLLSNHDKSLTSAGHSALAAVPPLHTTPATRKMELK